MEHIGIKLSIPSGVATVGVSARDDPMWESMPWPMVDYAEGVNGIAS